MAMAGFICDWWAVQAHNGDTSFTDDFEFAPANVVEATALLTAFAHTGGDTSIVCSGILEYRKRDPNTGVDQVVPMGSLGLFALSDLLVDSNVDSVTFGLVADDSGGGGFFDTRGDVVHQVWLWD
jgi:hypothetical protein